MTSYGVISKEERRAKMSNAQIVKDYVDRIRDNIIKTLDSNPDHIYPFVVGWMQADINHILCRLEWEFPEAFKSIKQMLNERPFE